MPSPSSALAVTRLDLGGALERFDLEMQKRGYIASQVMPIFNTPSRSGEYPVIPIAELLQQRDLGRSERGGYSRSSFKFDPATFSTKEYGTEEPVDDREVKLYTNYFDVELLSTMRAVEALLNGAEQRMVTALTDTGVITQTAAASIPWSNASNAAPLDDFATARDAIWAATGIWANAVVMSRNKFNQLKDCLQIVDRIKNNANYDVQRGQITEAMIASAFDVDKVIVSGTAKNSAKEGQTATIASTWTDTKVLVAKVATTNDLREPCIGRTFHWAEDGSQPLGTIETYRDETVRGDVVRVRHEVAEKVIYAKAGYLITAA